MAGNPLASLPGLPQRPSLARSSAFETRLTQPGIEAARSRKLNSAPTAAFRIKALRAPFSIKLHRTLHADRGDPESPDDVALLRIPTFTKLARDHAKGRDVVLRMDKHRHVAVEVRDLAVPPFKGQFVGDVGYASGKHRQMTLRHNTVSRGEPTELRPAPGSFLNPIERVTYRPSRTPSFAQPIDANRYFDGPSPSTRRPEIRRSEAGQSSPPAAKCR